MSKIERARKKLESTRGRYRNWMKQAEEAREEEDFPAARQAVKKALEICPESEEAREFEKQIKRDEVRAKREADRLRKEWLDETSWQSERPLTLYGSGLSTTYSSSSRESDSPAQALKVLLSIFLVLGCIGFVGWSFTVGWGWATTNKWILLGMCGVAAVVSTVVNASRGTFFYHWVGIRVLSADSEAEKFFGFLFSQVVIPLFWCLLGATLLGLLAFDLSFAQCVGAGLVAAVVPYLGSLLYGMFAGG